MPELQAAELSHFPWDETALREGLDIEGDLSWHPSACDFSQSDFETRSFPRFTYKGPKGKPQKNPTGS
jgi:hypothetical protein